MSSFTCKSVGNVLFILVVKPLVTNFHFYEKKRMDTWVPAESTGSPGNKSPQKSIIWTVDTSCPFVLLLTRSHHDTLAALELTV